MANTVYYSKKYQTAQHTQQTPAVKPAAAVPAPRHSMRMGHVLLVLCLLFGLGAVLVVPLIVDGAAQPMSGSANMLAVSQSAAVKDSVLSYESPEDTMAVLGIRPALPGTVPEGYSLGECRVVNGSVMELVYTNGKSTLLLRAAAGSEDLSGLNYDNYSYTATETVDGIVRGYTGVSEKKLLAAVWTNDDVAYAVVASDHVDAALLKEFAESVT